MQKSNARGVLFLWLEVDQEKLSMRKMGGLVADKFARRSLLGVIIFIFMVSGFSCEKSRPALTFSPSTLPMAQAGKYYEATVTVTNNVTPVGSISIDSGLLPDGLKLEHERGNNSARISGKPAKAGSYPLDVNAWCLGTNVSGQSGSTSFQIEVR